MLGWHLSACNMHENNTDSHVLYRNSIPETYHALMDFFVLLVSIIWISSEMPNIFTAGKIFLTMVDKLPFRFWCLLYPMSFKSIWSW